jgi:TetR/AcrR family transcriptional regulator
MAKLTDQSGPRASDTETEARILAAARRVFVRRGTAGARMQEIAAEAGVNQALLHYYFRSKDRLAVAVFREVAARLLPAMARVLGSEASLEQKVEQFVHLYIDTVRETPFIPAYILSELHHHPERLTTMRDTSGVQPVQMAAGFLRRLGTQLEERAASGAMRAMAPEQFVVSLMGLVVAPFLVRPALEAAFGMDDEAFARFLDARRAELPDFILNALRP